MSKQALKLSVGEVLKLNQELLDLNKESDLPFVLKYDLAKLSTKTMNLIRTFEKQKVALFEKYGVCTDEKKKIYTLEGSDKYDVGIKELEALIEKEETFTESFNVDDFKDLKSSNSYMQIMKFLK